MLTIMYSLNFEYLHGKYVQRPDIHEEHVRVQIYEYVAINATQEKVISFGIAFGEILSQLDLE